MKHCPNCNRKYLNNKSKVCQYCGGYLAKSNTWQCIWMIAFSIAIVTVLLLKLIF